MIRAKKIFTVSPYCVYPPINGGPKRIFYLNRGLARNGWEVFQFSGSTKRENGLHSLFAGIRQRAPSYQEYKYFNPLLQLSNRFLTSKGFPYIGSSLLPRFTANPAILKRQIDAHPYVMLEHPYWYRQVKSRLGKHQVLVLDAHNIEFKLFENKMHRSRFLRSAVNHLFELEKECFQGVDLAFTCSEEDKAIAVELFDVDPAHIHVAPNGVDIESVPVVSDDQRSHSKQELGLQGKTVALFVGSRWGPNIDAIHELVKIAPQRNDVHYLVVGGVGTDFQHVSLPNMTFTGFVEDLRPYTEAADLAVNPAVSGSGSNVKNFEYLAAGLPVVSTPFGARGIQGDSSLCLIQEELTQIPQRLAEVAGATEQLARRRVNARALAEARYDWTAISSGMSETILAAGERAFG